LKQLHDETTSETVDLLIDLSRVIRALMQLTGGPEDAPAMTPTQRIALFELVDAAPLRLTDLADRMGVSPPTASRSVDALHDLGLVERVEDPDDRRALNIDLTRAGRKMVVAHKRRARKAFAPAAEALSAEERETLSRLLIRMADALRESR
jgi:DNA-binding MarR family transcriptional regulator